MDYRAYARESSEADSQYIGISVQPVVAQADNLALILRDTMCNL